jgi:hypothetical protein
MSVRSMNSNSQRLPTIVPSTSLVASLYVLEFSALITAIAIYKKGEKLLLTFLATPAGWVLVVAVFALVTLSFLILLQLRNGPASWAKQFTAHLVLNLCSVALMLATAEVLIRVFTVSTAAGPMFANTLLLPRSWESVAAHSRAILAKASAQGSYLVYDHELGWTIGPSRHSKDSLPELQKLYSQNDSRYPSTYADDMYLSSVEGIRSPRVGMVFANVPARRRIAIVGDSFTFGLEVSYEKTWGHQLELALGLEYQVMNFGVDGYGVDQAYLRYRRDVLSWHPDIVILGVIEDDFRRTMGVYGFLTFPGGLPFPKPRFVVRDYGLAPLNLPLPDPEFIFTRQFITDLPFIEYDRSFQSAEWQWHSYFHAHSIRFLLSRFPRWPVSRPNIADEAMKSVNGEIFRSFLALARAQGSTPIVVYFPGRSDFVSPQSRWKGVAREVLQAYGIPFLDMTSCVSQVSPVERFAVVHYSAATNAVIAGCLRNVIREALRR